MNAEQLRALKERNRKTIKTDDGDFVIRRVNAFTVITELRALPNLYSKQEKKQVTIRDVKNNLPVIEKLLSIGVVDPKITFDGDTDPMHNIINIHDLKETTVDKLIEEITAYWTDNKPATQGGSSQPFRPAGTTQEG